MTRLPSPRVTLKQAAALSGLSYREVHRRASTGLVPAVKDHDTGVWTLSRHDAEQLQRRQPARDPRKAVQVRVPKAKYLHWERAAGDRSVAVWLQALGDAASGWENQEE